MVLWMTIGHRLKAHCLDIVTSLFLIILENEQMKAAIKNILIAAMSLAYFEYFNNSPLLEHEAL
jgi:hypothetical protein